jgi:hypothetical protein
VNCFTLPKVDRPVEAALTGLFNSQLEQLNRPRILSRATYSRETKVSQASN